MMTTMHLDIDLYQQRCQHLQYCECTTNRQSISVRGRRDFREGISVQGREGRTDGRRVYIILSELVSRPDKGIYYFRARGGLSVLSLTTNDQSVFKVGWEGIHNSVRVYVKTRKAYQCWKRLPVLSVTIKGWVSIHSNPPRCVTVAYDDNLPPPPPPPPPVAVLLLI